MEIKRSAVVSERTDGLCSFAFAIDDRLIDPLLNQKLRDFTRIVKSANMKSRIVLVSARVNISSPEQKVFHNIDVAVFARNVQTIVAQ